MSEIAASSSARQAPKAGSGSPASAASSANAVGAANATAAATNGRPVPPPASKATLVDPREMQKKLDEAVKRLNEQMQDNRRQLGFSVDDRLNRQIVRVTNKETGELVRQIPSEVVIRVANSIESLKGVLFDKES
jgi:flagellar protein FlaG